jgi:fructokinase
MYALFDIGGTSTRIAVSRDLQSFDEPIRFDTPQSYEEGIAAIENAIKKLRGSEKITRVAGGIRGPLNSDRSGIGYDDVLTDWQGKSLISDLFQSVDALVFLENDAGLAGLGEAHFGAGKGFPIVAYHTISTGMGGVRIVDEKIDRNNMGFEPGHQIIDADQTLCPTCASADLEDYISGSALEARFHKKPYDIPQTDPVWDELAHWLAHGLKNTIVYWSPDAVVLGGSMIVGDPHIRLSDIKRHTEALLGDLLPCPVIKDATLGDVGGLYGAMVLLSQDLKEKERL